MDCGRPPRRDPCIRNMIYTPFISMVAGLYGSPDFKNTNLHYRKMVLTKKNIQGMLNILHFV